jgi:hypothetical protein
LVLQVPHGECRLQVCARPVQPLLASVLAHLLAVPLLCPFELSCKIPLRLCAVAAAAACHCFLLLSILMDAHISSAWLLGWCCALQ